MKTINHHLELATITIKQLLKAERHCLTYLEVMAHKTQAPRFKAHIHGVISQVRKKIRYLVQLSEKLDFPPKSSITSGVNGIVSEGFGLMELVQNPNLKDALILRTIMLSSHYKLGSYRMLLQLLNEEEQEYERYLAHTLVSEEESIINRLMKLLQNSNTQPEKNHWPYNVLAETVRSHN